MKYHRVHISLNEDGSRFRLRAFRQAYDSTWRIEYQSPQWMLEFPDAKRQEDGYLEVGATDVSCDKLIAQKVRYDLEFDPDAEAMFKYLLLVSETGRSTATIVHDFKVNGVVPDDASIEYGQLSAYQKVGLTCALRSPGYGLFMKQGTGKSAIAVQAVVNDAIDKDKYRAIVVCPPNVRINWQAEFNKFATQPVDVHVLRGGQVKRLSQIINAVKSKCDRAVIVCNYETLQQSWDALSFIEFDLAVLDEGHYIKSKSTKRFEYAEKLRDNSKRRLILTGTPVANSIMDLYTLFEFMGKGMSGFRSYEGFRNFFGQFRGSDNGDVFTEAQNMPILKDRLARYSFIISKEEALPYLPDKVYSTLEVDMTEDQLKAYVKLRDELVMEIDNLLATTENEAVAVNNILTQLLRLSQITSSFKVIPAIIDENGTLQSPRRVIPFETNIKVNAILEDSKERPRNHKTIIWSNWVEDIKAMEAALVAAGESPVTFFGETSFDERLEAERRFNEDPNCRYFIGNPAAGGTGLNLLGYPPGRPDDVDTNCTQVYYMSQNWSSILREQSEDRAHRRGTREPVTITEVVVPQTIDVVIAKRVYQKRLNAMDALDIREVLSSIKESII
jgi:SNF2 family DNA or RNA helicase